MVEQSGAEQGLAGRKRSMIGRVEESDGESRVHTRGSGKQEGVRQGTDVATRRQGQGNGPTLPRTRERGSDLREVRGAEALMRTYGVANLDGYNRNAVSVRRVLTMVDRWPVFPGEIYDDAKGSWFLSCPGCSGVSLLTHMVTILDEAVSIIPSVRCPYNCGFEELITAWTLKMALGDDE